MRICKKNDYFSKINGIGIFACFVIVAFVAAMFFTPIKKSDANTVAVDTGTYSASIANSGTVAINVAPTSNQTIYNGTDVITYTNTCPHGFNVTLSSASEVTDLIRAGDDPYTKTISTIESNGSLTNNTWGFSIDDGTTYNAIPSLLNPTKLLEISSATTNATNLNVVYGVKINSDLPSGEYHNDIIYTLTISSQCLTYNVVWDFNGGTAADGATYPSAVGHGQLINLMPLIPTKQGSVFTGWANGETVFGPESENTDINPDELSSVTLVAQWEEVEPMQDFDASTMAMGDSKKVVDIRDNETYTIKKLADEKVWMTENLRIINKTMDSTDSDMESGTFAIPESDMSFSETELNTTKETLAAYVDPEVGGYYSWYTATAGTGVDGRVYGEAPSSICPKGWHMPTKNEYSTLYDNYNSYALMTDNDGPNFILTGLIADNKVFYKEKWGYYSSSTASGQLKTPSVSSSYTYWNQKGMQIDNVNSAVNLGGAGSRGYGYAVRCVADVPDTTPISGTMQSFSSSSLAVGQSAKLRDTRDGNIYTVKKLADGKVWMTQNLRLGGSSPITLTPSDSDVPVNVTFPATSSTNAYDSSSFGTQLAPPFIDRANEPNSGYYSWRTAIAGEYGLSEKVPTGVASRSICPKGWRLPTAYTSDSDWTQLTNLYSSKLQLRDEAALVPSGYFVRNAERSLVGSNGHYWSANTRVNIATNMAYMIAGSFGNETSVSANSSDFDRAVGAAIRCIAR